MLTSPMAYPTTIEAVNVATITRVDPLIVIHVGDSKPAAQPADSKPETKTCFFCNCGQTRETEDTELTPILGGGAAVCGNCRRGIRLRDESSGKSLAD